VTHKAIFEWFLLVSADISAFDASADSRNFGLFDSSGLSETARCQGKLPGASGKGHTTKGPDADAPDAKSVSHAISALAGRCPADSVAEKKASSKPHISGDERIKVHAEGWD